jgi:hypothetical protein
MDNVTHALKYIQLIPGAHVDRNYRQGHDAVLAQLQLLDGKEETTPIVDAMITKSQEHLAQLRIWVAPHHLPEDYVFFLEFCGGILIKTTDYNLMIDGIGPMLLEWYGFIMDGDGAIYENGLLSIGTLSFKGKRSGDMVFFLLDLAGTIHRNAVIGIRSWKLGESDLSPILQNPHAYPGYWSKLTDSFSEWLEQIATTGGALKSVG